MRIIYWSSYLCSSDLMRSTPSSVSFWTTRSGLSDLVRAKATVTSGAGGGTSTTSPAASSSGPPVKRHRRQDPRPSVAVRTSPVRRRRTLATWCSASGSSAGAATSSTSTWGSAPSGGSWLSATGSLEGGAQPGEEAPGLLGDLLAPQPGEPAHEALLLPGEVVGQVDDDGEVQGAPPARKCVVEGRGG